MKDKKPSFQIVIMGEEHVEQASICVANAFLREPMTRTLGINYEQVLNDFAKPVEKVARDGLSVVAIDDETGDVIGVCVNKDYTVSPVEEDNGYSDSLPIFTLVDQLDDAATQLINVPSNEVFHLYILAVDGNHCSEGIAAKLTERTYQIAKEKGFKQIVSEVTGPISQHIIGQKAGFQEIGRVNYRDFEYQGVKVFKSITDAEACLLVQKQLN